MDKKDLQHFRDLLIKERKRILEELDWVESNYIGKSRRDSSGDVSGYSMHPADMGTDSIEMEKAYMIGATGGAALEDIDEADSWKTTDEDDEYPYDEPNDPRY